MSIDSIDTLLAVLRRTQILADDQLAEVARELAPHYRDPQSLGEYLVEIDWLTAYQLQLLLSSQWDELTIGPYQILDRLGEGGVSEVFKAWDTNRGRIVALKVLRQHLAMKPDLVRQLQQEFQAITKLSHPNIIKTFDANQVGAVHYFAMEFVEGMDLARFVEHVGPLGVDMACEFARQAAQALQHAHQSGLVHRDIKPANLFLLHPPLPGTGGMLKRGLDPVVKVIDWGLARRIREGGSTGHSDNGEATKGALIGTADYIAPEQALDASLVDIRADIYSLGCTLYYLLAGQPPFPGSSLMVKIQRHQEELPPSLRAFRNDVPEELDAMIQKMLAKAPEDRYQIPLLLVVPLRKFASMVPANGAVRSAGSAQGLRPGSSATLSRPGSSASLPNVTGPGTAINLPRPATHGVLQRPGTHANLPRPGTNGSPGTSVNLPRPGENGHSSNGTGKH